MVKNYLLVILIFLSVQLMASAPEKAYFVIKNETGKDMVNFYLKARYAEKHSPNKGVDWDESFSISRLNNNKTSNEYTARFNYGFGKTGQNYWSIRAEFTDGSGISKEWKGKIPDPKWKQCSFTKKDKGKKLEIILKPKGNVLYKMPSSSNCEEKLEVYSPISTRMKLYSISHMTNTPNSITWAKGMEANGVEADLQFDKEGKPLFFKHGTPSDCTVETFNPSSSKESICSQLNGKSEGSLSTWFRSILDNEMPLVIIDTKVEDNWGRTQLTNAGKNVAIMLEKYLFSKGYQGKVFVGVPKAKYLAYLKAVNMKMNSNYKDRVFFSIDQEGNDFEKAYRALKELNTKQIVFGTGISIISPKNYSEGIKKAIKARNRGEIKFVYIWTIDKESSMKDYLNLGVDAVMTNKPRVLTKLIRANSSLTKPIFPQLATVDDSIPYIE